MLHMQQMFELLFAQRILNSLHELRIYFGVCHECISCHLYPTHCIVKFQGDWTKGIAASCAISAS